MFRLVLPLLLLGVSTLAAPADKNTYYPSQQIGVSAASISSGNGNYGTHISVVAPEGALVNRFQGSDGEQGVIVSQGSSGPSSLGGFGTAVSSSSSSSSSSNGITGTHQSSATHVNNNGQVTSVLVSNNKPY